MRKKQFIIAIIIIFIVLLAAVVYVRFIYGGLEDNWICDKTRGEWVRHGQPKSDKPSAICPLEKSANCSSTDSIDKDKCPINLGQELQKNNIAPGSSSSVSK